MLDWDFQVALRKTLRLCTGIAMLAVGILGLILPIMPGWIFVIPGLIILADYFPPIRRLLKWAKARAKAAGVGFHGDHERGEKAGGPPRGGRPPDAV